MESGINVCHFTYYFPQLTNFSLSTVIKFNK